MGVSDIHRTVDAWGRVTLSSKDALEIMYRGGDIAELNFQPDSVIEEYNQWCQRFDMLEHQVKPIAEHINTPEEEHAKRATEWTIASHYKTLDVRAELLSRCSRQEEFDRVNMEMDMFEEREMLPMLRMLFSLIDHFRYVAKLVWGVGRGSSVASYCLFLIGVHKIDSLHYDLDINEFLK